MSVIPEYLSVLYLQLGPNRSFLFRHSSVDCMYSGDHHVCRKVSCRAETV